MLLSLPTSSVSGENPAGDTQYYASPESASAARQSSLQNYTQTIDDGATAASSWAEYAESYYAEIQSEPELFFRVIETDGFSVSATSSWASVPLEPLVPHEGPADVVVLGAVETLGESCFALEPAAEPPPLTPSDPDGHPTPDSGQSVYDNELAVPVVIDQSAEPSYSKKLLSSPLPYAVAVGMHVRSDLSLFSHLYELLSRFWYSGISPLFSRLRREKVLENPQRAKIFSEIEANPGIWYREIIRKLGLTNGQLSFHLHRLETSGLIRSTRVRGRRHLVTNGCRVPMNSLVISVRQRGILEFLLRNGGAVQQTLVESLNMSRPAISYNLRVLISLGCVEVGRRGGLKWYRVADPHPARA